MENTKEITVEVFRLLRERMATLAHVQGPLLAGTFKRGALSGDFLLTELRQWRSLTEGPDYVPGSLKPEDVLLSDAEVASVIPLSDVIENLLREASALFDRLLAHLQRIKNHPTLTTDIALYLTVSEAIVLDTVPWDQKL